MHKSASPNLRSLVFFGPTPDCSKQRLLKVLRTEEIEFKGLEGSTQLRYFEYAYSDTNLKEDPYFERFISSMKFLETLNLESKIHGDLPDCIWLVKTLRHVTLGEYTSGPSSGTDLRNLQTLKRVRSRKSWATGAGIPKLPNLRELDTEIIEELPWEVVLTLLGTLKHLTHLELVARFKVADMSGIPSCPHLQMLDISLEYPCDEIIPLGTSTFSIHLTWLFLEGLQLDQDPMPILEKLQNLRILSIRKLNYHKKQMRFSAKGFAQLEELCLVKITNLEELEIEEGAMPMLKELGIYECPQLCVPLSLQHLNSLKELYWSMSTDDMASTKPNEIRNVCKHVPTIKFSLF